MKKLDWSKAIDVKVGSVVSDDVNPKTGERYINNYLKGANGVIIQFRTSFVSDLNTCRALLPDIEAK